MFSGATTTSNGLVVFAPSSNTPDCMGIVTLAPPVVACTTQNTFTTKASLKTAVTEFNSNAASAIAKYGPIADWCVSAITDMNFLFDGMANFDADISSWDTSSVTTMYRMFHVRSARALGLSLK